MKVYYYFMFFLLFKYSHEQTRRRSFKLLDSSTTELPKNIPPIVNRGRARFIPTTENSYIENDDENYKPSFVIRRRPAAISSTSVPSGNRKQSIIQRKSDVQEETKASFSQLQTPHRQTFKKTKVLSETRFEVQNASPISPLFQPTTNENIEETLSKIESSPTKNFQILSSSTPSSTIPITTNTTENSDITTSKLTETSTIFTTPVRIYMKNNESKQSDNNITPIKKVVVRSRKFMTTSKPIITKNTLPNRSRIRNRPRSKPNIFSTTSKIFNLRQEQSKRRSVQPTSEAPTLGTRGPTVIGSIEARSSPSRSRAGRRINSPMEGRLPDIIPKNKEMKYSTRSSTIYIPLTNSSLESNNRYRIVDSNRNISKRRSLKDSKLNIDNNKLELLPTIELTTNKIRSSTVNGARTQSSSSKRRKSQKKSPGDSEVVTKITITQSSGKKAWKSGKNKISDLSNSQEDIRDSDNYPEPFKSLIQAKKIMRENSRSIEKAIEATVSTSISSEKPTYATPRSVMSVSTNTSHTIHNQHFKHQPDVPIIEKSKKTHSRITKGSSVTVNESSRVTRRNLTSKASRSLHNVETYNKNDQKKFINMSVPNSTLLFRNTNRYSSRYRSDLTPSRTTTNAPAYLPTIPTIIQSTSILPLIVDKDLGFEVISFEDPVNNFLQSDNMINENVTNTASETNNTDTISKPKSIIERIINSLTTYSTVDGGEAVTTTLSPITTKSTSILKLTRLDKMPHIDHTVTTEKPTTIIERILTSLSAIQADDSFKVGSLNTLKSTTPLTSESITSFITTSAPSFSTALPLYSSAIINENEQSMQNRTIVRLVDLLKAMIPKKSTNKELTPSNIITTTDIPSSIITQENKYFLKVKNTDTTESEFTNTYDPKTTTNTDDTTSSKSTLSTTKISESSTINIDASNNELLSTLQTTSTMSSLSNFEENSNIVSTIDYVFDNAINYIDFASSTTINSRENISMDILENVSTEEAITNSITTFSNNIELNGRYSDIVPLELYNPTFSLDSSTVTDVASTTLFDTTIHSQDYITENNSNKIDTNSYERVERLLNFLSEPLEDNSIEVSSVDSNISISTTNSSSTILPKLDYFVFAILNNNTILRKRPDQFQNAQTPYFIVSVLPNNTIVRRFPNGTLVPSVPVLRVNGFDTRENPPTLPSPVLLEKTTSKIVVTQGSTDNFDRKMIDQNTIPTTIEANIPNKNKQGDVSSTESYFQSTFIENTTLEKSTDTTITVTLPPLIELLQGKAIQTFNSIINISDLLENSKNLSTNNIVLSPTTMYDETLDLSVSTITTGNSGAVSSTYRVPKAETNIIITEISRIPDLEITTVSPKLSSQSALIDITSRTTGSAKNTTFETFTKPLINNKNEGRSLNYLNFSTSGIPIIVTGKTDVNSTFRLPSFNKISPITTKTKQGNHIEFVNQQKLIEDELKVSEAQLAVKQANSSGKLLLLDSMIENKLKTASSSEKYNLANKIISIAIERSNNKIKSTSSSGSHTPESIFIKKELEDSTHSFNIIPEIRTKKQEIDENIPLFETVNQERIRTTTPEGLSKTKTTTTEQSRPLMQSLNWLLNAFGTTTRPKSKTTKTLLSNQEEALEQHSTSSKVLQVHPSNFVISNNIIDSLSQEEVRKLINQLEVIQKNPIHAQNLNINSLKSLQNLIASNDDTTIQTPKPTSIPMKTTTMTLKSNIRSNKLKVINKRLPTETANENKFEIIDGIDSNKMMMHPVELRPVAGVQEEDSLIRGRLISAALGVTKAISEFLGSALQSATKSFQTLMISSSRTSGVIRNSSRSTQ